MKYSKQYYVKRFLGLNFLDKIYILTFVFKNRLQKLFNFKGKYTFSVDNRGNCENLVIIIAGYQEYTWECVFERVKKYLDIQADIVIVSCGKYCEKLKQIAEKNNWSYLYTKDNKVALGLNLAIQTHPKAQYIYKMDEDIFITKGLFKNLRDKYEYSLKYSPFIPGGITPVLNINGFSYIKFLETIGKSQEFKTKFGIKGPLKQPLRDGDVSIFSNGDIAQYIRENTVNIDTTQEKYFDQQDIKKEFISCSVKYSIGCFLFHRSIWEKMGGFLVSIEKVLGREEEEYMNFCINKSYPVILCENALAGHLSFGPQKKQMEEYFLNNKSLFFITNHHEKK